MTKRNDKKSPKLLLKKETLRELRSLSEEQLRAVNGGVGGGGNGLTLPSIGGC